MFLVSPPGYAAITSKRAGISIRRCAKRGRGTMRAAPLQEFASVSVPSASTQPALDASADAELAHQLVATSERFFAKSRFASLEAMLALAIYRLAAIAESLGVATAFGTAAIVEGVLRRAVKSKQFEHHHPEIFGACSLLIMLATVAAALAASCH